MKSNCINVKTLMLLVIISLVQFSSISSKGKFRLKHKSKQNYCNLWKGPMSMDQKQVVLNSHNWYRNQIALQQNTIGPKLSFAKNMIQMYWSDAMSVKAQQWANNCKFQHSTKEFRRQPDFPTGENIYETSVAGNFQQMDWNRPTTAWFNEIKDFGSKSIDNFAVSGPITGHFTQVIWANSYLIGCGFSQHKDGGWFTSLYICHYGPVGNVVGTPIYDASNHRICMCPERTSCSNSTFSGLCCAEGSCNWNSQFYTGPIIPGTVPKNTN